MQKIFLIIIHLIYINFKVFGNIFYEWWIGARKFRYLKDINEIVLKTKERVSKETMIFISHIWYDDGYL